MGETKSVVVILSYIGRRSAEEYFFASRLIPHIETEQTEYKQRELYWREAAEFNDALCYVTRAKK